MKENVNFSKQSKVAVCPNCGKDILDTPKAYSCNGGRDGCGFIVWKTISGRKIDLSTVKELLNKGITQPKEFISKAGKNYSAKLKLDEDNKVVFEYVK